MFDHFSANRFNYTKKSLYHFTGSSALISILSSMQLNFSSFSNLNDLNESEVNFQIDGMFVDIFVKEYIVENCRLISFAKDKVRSGKLLNWAINLPRSWAQYADNNTGACIVLDEHKLKNRNKDLFIANNVWIKDVKYAPFLMKETKNSNPEVKSIIFEMKNELFFEKHANWKDEQERRLLVVDKIKSIDITDCIEYICIGAKFPQGAFQSLISLLVSRLSEGKYTLAPHDFARQVNSHGRCSALDNSGQIFTAVQRLQVHSEHYLKAYSF